MTSELLWDNERQRQAENEKDDDTAAAMLSRTKFLWKGSSILVVFVALASVAVLLFSSSDPSSHAGALKQQQQHRQLAVDPNTLVTDVDKLPAVPSQGATKEIPDLTMSNTAVVSLSSDLFPSEDLQRSPTAQQEEPAGFRHPVAYYSDKYLRRALDSRRTTTAASWGMWTFQDPNPSTNRQSPTELEQLANTFPNRDIPRTKFPPTAWQVDAAYLEPWLQQGIDLTERALKAILAEYGHYDPKGSMSLAEAMADDDPTKNAYMFKLCVADHGCKIPRRQAMGLAGIASPTALARLKRLLLHSIMTQDTFFITMGGHSSAAAHGNHFQQSYTLQIQRVLEPVLARLGVYHQARNVGMGGLGTLQNALAAQTVYGGDNSILIWDSGMTENDMPSKDLFVRQGILGGERVPLIVGNPLGGKYDKLCEFGVFQTGFWGTGTVGLPRTEDPVQVEQIPYAARYIECSKEMWTECRKKGYNGVCWIDRPDFEPKTKQGAMGGRAKWHPGNFSHQHAARLFAYNVIKILREALLEWKNADGFALPDEAWHVTDSFKTIRETVLSQNSNETSECFQLKLPDIVCKVPFTARSEYTPRANPKETSIRSILHPDVDISGVEPNSYDPPDVYNPAFHPPDGEIDYMAIVESGNDFLPMLKRREHLQKQLHPPARPAPKAVVSALAPGKGWELVGPAAPDNCDGTYDSFCNRGAKAACLLYAHNDNRANLVGDALSGWLKMTITNVQHGTIIVRTEHRQPNSVMRTEGWKCENNAETCDKPLESAAVAADCDDWTFEFAINGVVTKWSKEDYDAKMLNMQRVVQLHVLLDDPSLIPSGQQADIEVAIRVGGNCGRAKAFGLSHIYWA